MTVLVIVVIIIERYASRTDTKAEEQKRLSESDNLDNNGFFKDHEMFKRASTARSMTVRLKTMKTSDVDMQSGSA
jgi:hypothetical protein